MIRPKTKRWKKRKENMTMHEKGELMRDTRNDGGGVLG